MSEVAMSLPQVIVVAEQAVYDLLATCGAQWDVQHRIETVGQMWDDLAGGRLSQTSSILVFSDCVPAKPGELEAAIAAMAPHAAVFVVAWKADEVDALLARVHEAAIQQGVPVDPVYPLTNTETGFDLLDGIAQVVYEQVSLPEEWPAHTAEPLHVEAEAALEWTHEDALQEVPEVAVAPLAQPGSAAYAPAYTNPVSVSPLGVDPSIPPPLPGQVTLTCTSSKGGSGKSTTAIMTASQIRQSSVKAAEMGLIERPLKVILVDMDTRDGQVASLIGQYVPTALNIRVSPQWDMKTILQNVVHDPKTGLDALLAPVRPRTADDVGPDFYRHVIRMLKSEYDVVVMDTSVNYLDPLISTVCLPEATAILFVTTLATTSVQGMARALREITEPVENGGMGIKKNKIGIVVNQSVTEVGMDKDQVLQAALRVPIVGAIPLATRDVLTATNYNRMHLLLKHPLLGPAYHRLASACMKGVTLPPLVADGQQPPAAPVAPVAAQPVAVPVAEQQRRGGVFGRRGR